MMIKIRKAVGKYLDEVGDWMTGVMRDIVRKIGVNFKRFFEEIKMGLTKDRE